jgi:hypothetical protein
VDFLQFSFRKDSAVSGLIAQKSFWLFLPPRTPNDPSYLLHEEDWKQVAKDGVKVVMTLYTHNTDYFHLGDNRRRRADRAMVHLESPLPPWFEFPETLEFRWLYGSPPNPHLVKNKPNRYYS